MPDLCLGYPVSGRESGGGQKSNRRGTGGVRRTPLRSHTRGTRKPTIGSTHPRSMWTEEIKTHLHHDRLRFSVGAAQFWRLALRKGILKAALDHLQSHCTRVNHTKSLKRHFPVTVQSLYSPCRVTAQSLYRHIKSHDPREFY